MGRCSVRDSTLFAILCITTCIMYWALLILAYPSVGLYPAHDLLSCLLPLSSASNRMHPSRYELLQLSFHVKLLSQLRRHSLSLQNTRSFNENCLSLSPARIASVYGCGLHVRGSCPHPPPLPSHATRSIWAAWCTFGIRVRRLSHVGQPTA